MGIMDLISSTVNTVNESAVKPVKDICSTSYSYGCAAATTSYSYGCAAATISYSYGCAAATKIGNAIKVDRAVQKLTQQLKDQDSRSNITQFATSVAKNAAVVACREGLKAVPGGGPIFEIASRSLPNNKSLAAHKHDDLKHLKSELEDHKAEFQELKAVVHKMAKEQSNLPQVVNQAEVHEPYTDVDFESEKYRAYENQATAIRFLMGKNLLSNENKQPGDYQREMFMKGFVSSHALDDLNKTTKCLDLNENKR